MDHDPELARLLSGRNEPSVLEKERILEQVLSRTAPPSRARWWAAAFATAALGMALLAVPSDPEFTHRGAEEQALFELRCVQEGVPSARCHPGQTLVFDVEPGARYFGAFARREDDVILWYFPAEGEGSLPLADTAAQGTLERAVVLGADHPPGTYEVYGVFTDAPWSRDQIREAMDDDLRSARGAVVVRRELKVEALR